MEMNLFYYAIGIISGICLMLILPLTRPGKILNFVNPKIKWKKISNVDYSYDVVQEFKSKNSVATIAYALAIEMQNQIEKNPGNLGNVIVDPGKYKINMETKIRFVHLENET